MNLWKLCEETQYNCDPRKFINENVDSMFDEFVSRARRITPETTFISNKHFYMEHNLGKFRIIKDEKDNGEKYDKFVRMLKSVKYKSEKKGIE
jgi:hypothetical protein